MGSIKIKEKTAKRLTPTAIDTAVSGYLAAMPIFRRLERTYKFKYACTALLFLLRQEGAMSVYRAMKLYRGYEAGASGYRSVLGSLSLLRDKGLVVNGGGKWWLTDKGERAILGEGD